MKWNVGTKINAGFGLMLVISAVIGGMSWWSIKQSEFAEYWRTHTYQVLDDLSELLSLTKDVEASQRGYVITGEDSYLAPYEESVAKIDPQLQDIRVLTADNPRQQQRLDVLKTAIHDRLELAKQIVDARRGSGFDAAAQLVKAGNGMVLMNEIRQVLGDMQGEEKMLLEQRTSVTEADAKNLKGTIIIGMLMAFAAAVALGVLLTRNIARPLERLTELASRITEGNLKTPDVKYDRDDEVGVLGNAFQRMSENLREQLKSLSEGVALLGSSASEIVASTTQLAASASESATAVSETTTTVEEVRQTAQMASQKARLVSETAQKATQTSAAGRKSVEEAIGGMNRIRQQMEAIAGSMARLGEQSQTIGQIIATVEDLAAQSNLLAVNAAIEATKAGEHGKGFGVVAQEVRSLAEQSKEATREVRTILNEIQKATAAAVLATEQGSKAVESGERQTGGAADSIQSLNGVVVEAAQAATQIAASSQQQLVGMDQVAVAMESIKQSSSQNVASAKQLENAAVSLNGLGQRLKEVVGRYNL